MEAPIYLHLKPSVAPPHLDSVGPFKVVLIIDTETTSEWMEQVSRWLVQSGCRYMMAWGKNRGDWHSSIDEANMAMFDYREIPDDEFVMTTDHKTLQDACWFAGYCAMHPTLELERTYLVHISQKERAEELLESYRSAQEETD